MRDFYVIASVAYTPNSKDEAFQFTYHNIIKFLEQAILHKVWLALFYEAIGHSIAVRQQWERISQRFIERISLNVETVKQKGLARNEAYNTQVVAGCLYYPGEQYLWKIVLGQTSEDIKKIAWDIAEVYTNGLFK